MKSCDECEYQEWGHYCLLHSKMMKNMNIKRCKDWEEKKEAKTVLFAEDVIRNCLADERMVAKARRYGKQIVIEGSKLVLIAYRWRGITYVVEVSRYVE